MKLGKSNNQLVEIGSILDSGRECCADLVLHLPTA